MSWKLSRFVLAQLVKQQFKTVTDGDWSVLIAGSDFFYRLGHLLSKLKRKKFMLLFIIYWQKVPNKDVLIQSASWTQAKTPIMSLKQNFLFLLNNHKMCSANDSPPFQKHLEGRQTLQPDEPLRANQPLLFIYFPSFLCAPHWNRDRHKRKTEGRRNLLNTSKFPEWTIRSLGGGQQKEWQRRPRHSSWFPDSTSGGFYDRGEERRRRPGTLSLCPRKPHTGLH